MKILSKVNKFHAVTFTPPPPCFLIQNPEYFWKKGKETSCDLNNIVPNIT